MAGIFANVDSDITKLKQLKAQIEEVKKALKSIDVKVDIDIAKGMEAQLKNLTTQYDALVQKVSQAEGKIIASTQRINQAAEKITKAQEQLAKATGTQQTGNATGSTTAENQAETASVQAQAKAYDDLADEIDAVMGTRSQNIRRMIEEQNAIRLINEEIKKLTKYQGENSTLSSSQQRRLEQLNASLLQHKTALSELRQSLNNSFKIDNSAATSMNALSQSLGRMRMAYRELTEEERKSPFGQELLASIQQADAKIKQLDATIGNHQRNVGNYASGWNGLNMSVQQIVRELPAATMGLNMFFLAISNNLPILTDEIKRARDMNEQLKKSGKSTVPVWKQLVGSIFSWQTAMMVAITVLSMYGKDIANWISGLFGANEAHKRLNESVKEFNSLVGESQAKAKLLFETIKKAGEGTQGRADAIKQFNDEYGKYYSNMLSEQSSLLEIEKAYKQVNKALMENAALKAQQSAIDKTLESAIKAQSEALMKIQGSVGTQNARPVTETVMSWTEEYMQAGMKWEQAFGDIAENIRKKVGKLPDDFYTALEDYVKSVYESSREIQNIQDKYNPFFDKEKADKAVVQNRDYWENQRKLLVEQLNALSDLEAKGKKGIKIKLSIQNIDNKLESFNISSAKSYNSINSQKEKIDDILRKQAIERKRQQIELENQVAQARIDAMADGEEKERAQIELDNKIELQAIKKQKQEYIQSVIQAQKEIFDAQEELKAKQDKNYKKQKFDDSSVRVDTSAYDELFALTQSRQVSDQWDKQDQAMNRYLSEYGTFQQRRLAITQEYQQKIAAATTEGEKMMLQKQMEEALKDLDFSQFKDSINFADIFGNLDAQTTDALKSLRDKLEEYINNAAKDLNPEDLKELQDAFKDLDFKIAERDPFGEFGKSLDEYRESQSEVAKAQQDLNTVMQGGTVVTGVYTDETGKLVVETLSQAKAEEKLNNAQKKRAETLANLTTTMNSIGSQGSQLVNTGNELVGMLENLGVAVPEAVSSTLSGLGQVMNGLGSIDITKPFSLITGAVSVFAGIGNTIAGWFGGGDKKNEKQIQRLQEQVETLEKSYEKLDKEIEKAYSTDAAGLIEDQNKLLEQQKVLIQQQIAEEEDKKHTDNDRIEEWKQQLEEINETLEENKEKAIEAITGTDVMSAIDEFAQAYADAWASGEDAAKASTDTVKKLIKTSLLEFLKKQLSPDVEEFMGKLAEYMSDGIIDPWEQAQLDRLAENMDKTAQNYYDQTSKYWEDEDTAKQQQSSKGYSITASQDSVDEMNGRLTAMAESNYRIEDATQQQTLAITDIKGSIAGLTAQVQASYNVGDEVRTILAQSYIELQAINENTGAIVKPIQQMQKDIEEVKRNTSRL